MKHNPVLIPSVRLGLVATLGFAAALAGRAQAPIYPTNSLGQVVRSGRPALPTDLPGCGAFVPDPLARRQALEMPAAGDGELVNYRAFDGTNYLMRQFLGRYTALYISPTDLDRFTLAQARELVDLQDLLYATFREFMGIEPNGSGLLKVAFVKTCGAGCGYVGSRGVELDPGYTDDTVANVTGVLVHELTHNFDRWSGRVMYGSDVAHAWTDFMSFYIRVADRAGSSSRHPEDNLRRRILEYFQPYLEHPGSTWETCIRDAGCADVSAQHTQGGLALRLGELQGVAATRRAMHYLRDAIAARGLSSSSMTITQKNDLLIESFSHGARTNLACYFDTWNWLITPTLRAQLTTAFGALNLNCADQDADHYSVVQGDWADTLAGIHPGAPELVNGLDDDCDGTVDNVLFTEAGDFPNGTGGSFPVHVPSRVLGALGASDGDFFQIVLTNTTQVRITLRSADGVFQGWLFLYQPGGSGWQEYFHVGAGSQGDQVYTLAPGRWDFGVELNNASTPGNYELSVEETYPWPVLAWPPAPLNVASNRWRLSTPPVPIPLQSVTNLLARFWVSGFGWVATNPVPSMDGATFDWLAPAGTDPALTQYRHQFFAGEFAAERASEPTPLRANQPPAVTLLSPATGSSFPPGSNLTLVASVNDPEGALRWLNIYQGTTLLATLTNAPFVYALSNLAEGTYTFAVVATDGPGATVSSAPVSVTITRDRVLVASGSVWQYHDAGVDLGTSWRGPAYSDAAWLSGPAPLGYGDNDEATVIRFGSDPDNKPITAYFRQTFELAAAATLTNLQVRLLRDDGGVVYLNGTEIFRDNLPAGPIGFSTRASAGATDEEEITLFHATGVNPALLVNGPNVVAVEIHQESASSSDLSFDLALIAGVSNQSPLVTLTHPPDGATFLAPANVTLLADASDADGQLTRVEFYRDEVAIGERTVPPYQFNVPSLPVGNYVFTARARDHNGTVATSAPVQVAVVAGTQVTLIRTGATWKYLDTGIELGTLWRSPSFNDATWPAGPAQLGYGDGDEQTVVRMDRTDGTRIITTYFRHHFSVAQAGMIRSLTARLLRDDGAIVYLNGAEAFRSNMPEDAVNSDTRSDSTVNAPEESSFYSYPLNPAWLISGDNVLAVELHQASSTSSDISFDFELTGLQVNPARPSLVLAASPAGILATWQSDASDFHLLYATTLRPPVFWRPVTATVAQTNDRYSVTIPWPATANYFLKLQWP